MAVVHIAQDFITSKEWPLPKLTSVKIAERFYPAGTEI